MKGYLEKKNKGLRCPNCDSDDLTRVRVASTIYITNIKAYNEAIGQ
jgi:Zn finger protein HypA/HybF involved in hydrogenase expression